MFRSTTVLTVRRGRQVAIGGDGQVSLGDTVIKSKARKIRRLYEDKIIIGFAGATADAFSLMERFEAKLKQYQGNLVKSAHEMAREWRTDRVLRRLEAQGWQPYVAVGVRTLRQQRRRFARGPRKP